jgi:hypothetical protein
MMIHQGLIRFKPGSRRSGEKVFTELHTGEVSHLPSKETCTLFLVGCDSEEDRAGLVEEDSTFEGGLLLETIFMVETAGGAALPLRSSA